MMANVIDTVYVALGLDTKEYQKNQKEATDSLSKFSRATEASNKNAQNGSKMLSESLGKVKIELLAIASAALGAVGVKDLITSTVQSNISLGRMSTNLGESARSLDAWKAVANSVGGSGDALLGTFQNLRQELFKYSINGASSEMVDAFRTLGITPAEAGKAKDSVTLMHDIADAMSKISDPQKQIKIAAMLGFDAGGLAVIRLGAAGIDSVYQQMYKLSGVTKESTQNAKEFQKQWAILSQTFSGAAGGAVTKLAPVLSGALSLFTKSAEGWRSLFDPEYKYGTRFKQVGNRSASGKINYGKGTNILDKIEQEYPGIPKGMLYKIEGIESNHDPNALGPVTKTGERASGAFQLMPKVAKAHGLTFEGTLNEENSARVAASELTQLMKKYHGDIPKVLAGYNWGQGNVDEYGMGRMPHETRDYIAKFMGASAGVSSGASSNNKSEVHIQTINIETQSTDANGIAHDMHRAIQNNNMIVNNMSGMGG
jgi:soluble lytic murein transglycosylase-like protein